MYRIQLVEIEVEAHTSLQAAATMGSQGPEPMFLADRYNKMDKMELAVTLRKANPSQVLRMSIPETERGNSLQMELAAYQHGDSDVASRWSAYG